MSSEPSGKWVQGPYHYSLTYHTNTGGFTCRIRKDGDSTTILAEGKNSKADAALKDAEDKLGKRNIAEDQINSIIASRAHLAPLPDVSDDEEEEETEAQEELEL